MLAVRLQKKPLLRGFLKIFVDSRPVKCYDVFVRQGEALPVLVGPDPGPVD